MADLALDTTGDLLITDNALTIVDGDDALVQHLSIRLRFFLGSWFLDQRVGIPYFDKVLIKNPKLVVVRGVLRSAILTTTGVDAIDEFEFDFDTARRKMSVSFTVRKTGGGTLDYSKEFIVG